MSIITLPTLNRANISVTTELARHGFWTERLDRIEVFLVPFSWACYGWQWYGSTGEICIPSVSVARLVDLLKRRGRAHLRDVLRHEWGNAVADTHRGLFRSRRFSSAFGGSHERIKACMAWDPYHHVTPYAATNPSEDFAEVFHLWLKHGGRMPASFQECEGIHRRRNFVSEMAEAMQDGVRRW